MHAYHCDGYNLLKLHLTSNFFSEACLYSLSHSEVKGTASSSSESQEGRFSGGKKQFREGEGEGGELSDFMLSRDVSRSPRRRFRIG